MKRHETASSPYQQFLKLIREKREAATAPRGRETTMMQPHLPDGYALKNYGGDLVLTGPGLNDDIYREVLASLPEPTTERIIGWKATAR